MGKSNKQRERESVPPPLPEPLPVPVVDNHVHLDIVLANVPGTTAAGELDKAAEVGIDRVVQIGTEVPSSIWAADLAEADQRVLAAVAIHPNDAARMDAATLDAATDVIDGLAARPRVRAVGETGLDYFRTRDQAAQAIQREAFARHIDIAKRHGIALMIHDRDAHEAIFDVLAVEGVPDTVVFHCYSGDAEMARRCADAGYYMSFAGNVTFPSNGHLREAMTLAPPELLLVETDAPFLTPIPDRGRPNSSYLVPTTVRAMAAERGVDLAELCSVLSHNSERVYGGW